jgi:PKD repeat protein
MLVLTAFVGMTANVGATGLPPVAEAGGPYFGYECDPAIIFDASASYDPESSPLMYRWNIDGSHWTEWSFAPEYDHTYFDDFLGTINLNVTDGDLEAIDTADVTILNVPPYFDSISGPMEPVEVGQEITIMVSFFDGAADPRIGPASTDTYDATFYWGDGSSDVISLGVEEFLVSSSHTYSEPGVYQIVILIEDDDGGMATIQWYVYVYENGDIPQLYAGPDCTIDEGSMLLSHGFFSLPEDEAVYTATVEYGDGSAPLSLNLEYMYLQHRYVENGEYALVITVLKDGEFYGSDSALITVVNVPPTIIWLLGLPDDPIQLGNPVNIFGFFTDPGIEDDQVALIEWGDEQSTTLEFLANELGRYDVSESHIYSSAGAYMITLTVTDDDAGSDSAMLEYNIVYVDAGPDAFINEGDWFTSEGSFVYSGDYSFTATVDYGDGSGSQTLDVEADYTFALSHLYVDNGVYSVVVTILKDEAVFMSDNALVTVANVPPIATLGNNGPKDEGSEVMVSFSNQFDPGILDTLTYSFDWNNDGIYEISDQVDASAVYTWYDNGLYNVKGKIKDNDGGCNEYITAVTVNNVPPTIISLSGPPTDPVQLGTPITLNGVFTDPGILDTHSALIEWGDGQTTTIDLEAGIYEVSGSHAYTNVGVYKINLTVTDKDGGLDRKSIDYFTVIYDANSGFVTGGGWIIALEGSYRPDPALTGKATFGFVAKYKKGQSVPTGNTEFQFHPAKMNFHSHSYDWLIIVGPVAMYKGSGTINGEGDYGFILTATDGRIEGGGGVDTFRIKIWDKTNGDLIVFDNNENTELSGGQITIHKG